MPNRRGLSFITFFGAPGQLDVLELTKMAQSSLKKGGILIITGYPNLEQNIDKALTLGGEKVILSNTHSWDSLAFVYKN